MRQKTTRRSIAQGREVRSERARRPVYLFSGLIKCAACGGGFSIISANHYGCSNARNRGTCSNRTAVRRDVLEESVLSGLKEQLMEPELVKEFIAEYHRELNRLRATAEQDGQMHLREIAKIDREIGRLVQAIKDGIQASSVGDELEKLEAHKGRLESAVQRDPEPTPRLHPNLAELYRQKVANLREALNQRETRSEAALLIRELVQEIRLHPIDGALQIELVGDLARILSLASKNPRRGDATGVQLTLVAGAGFEPATFRL